MYMHLRKMAQNGNRRVTLCLRQYYLFLYIYFLFIVIVFIFIIIPNNIITIIIPNKLIFSQK